MYAQLKASGVYLHHMNITGQALQTEEKKVPEVGMGENNDQQSVNKSFHN